MIPRPLSLVRVQKDRFCCAGNAGPVIRWGRMTAIEADPSAHALAYIEGIASGPPLAAGLDVTVNFHPDRLVGAVPLLEHLGRDGLYRSQFETTTSNGGLTAYPGGDRWQWEHRMFDGAYDDAAPSHRPKYGSLNYRQHQAGGSVRFGSAHLRLARHVITRTTFCYPDSAAQPTSFGTAEHMSLLELAAADDIDVLDDHIEAHVHGPLHLKHDVEAVVLDPPHPRGRKSGPHPPDHHLS